MAVDLTREAWMTVELEEKLRAIAEDNALSCRRIQEFAAEHGLEITKMKDFLDLLDIKPLNCQKLCS